MGIRNLLRDTQAKYEIIMDIMYEANVCINVNTFYDKALDILINRLDIEAGGFYVVNDYTNTASLEFQKNMPDSFSALVKNIKISDPPYNKVFIDKSILKYNHLMKEEPGFYRATQYQSFVCIPVFSKDNVIGAIIMADTDKNKFKDTEDFFVELGHYIGPVIIKYQYDLVLKKSEKKFRNIFEFSLNAVALHKIISDSQGNPYDFIFLDANAEYEKIVGLDKDSLIGKRGSDLKEYLPDIYYEIYKTINNSEEHIQYEHYSEKKNKYYKISAFTFEKEFFSTIVVDITERKIVENVTKESESNLQTLYNTIDDFLIVFDSKWNIIKYNIPVAHVLGYTDDELHRMNILDLHSKEYHNELKDKIKIIEEEKDRTFKIPIKTKSGYEIPVETKVSKGTWSGQEVYFAISRDIRVFLESEEEIRKSEEKLAKVFQLSPAAISLCTFDDNIYIDVNDAFLDMFGYNKEEVIGQNAENVLLYEDISICSILKEDLIRNKQVKDKEITLTNNNGDIKICNFSSVTIDMNDTKYILTSILDLTEKRNIEEKVLRIGTAIDFSSDAVIIMDESYVPIYQNNAFKDIFGQSLEALKNIDRFHSLYVNSQSVSEMMKNIKSGQSWDGEVEMLTIRASIIQMHIRTDIIRNEDGEFKGVLAIFTDITKLKKTEVELLRSKKRFQDIALSSADLIWELNNDGIYTFASGQSKELLGYTSAEIIGKSPIEMMNDSESQKFVETFEFAAQRNISVTDFEHWRVTKEGNDVCILTSAVPIANNKGIITGFRGVDKNITQRKQAEIENQRLLEEIQFSKKTLETTAQELLTLNNKLQESERNLKELNSTKDKFFSIISHDLRSPFSALMGYSEMLMNNYEMFSDEDKLEFITDIHKTGTHLFKLLENLLNWARAQTGNIKYQPAMISLKEVADDVLMLQKTNAENKNIRLFSSVAPEAQAYADFNMAMTVVRNLVSNALKFTEENGQVEIACNINCEKVEIAVIDDGLGMHEDDRNKLFKIGEHFTTKGTANESGTGLGLILCKEFVESNGGKIRVESQLGKGSSFIFSLPLKQAEEA